MGYGPIKRCSCGKWFLELPKEASFHPELDELSGHYWECSNCQSTLFLPLKDPDEEDKSVLYGA